MKFYSLLKLSSQCVAWFFLSLSIHERVCFSASKARNVIPDGEVYISLRADEINSGAYDLDQIRKYRAYRICEELGFQGLDSVELKQTRAFSPMTKKQKRGWIPRYTVREYHGDRADFFISIQDYSEFMTFPGRSVYSYTQSHEVFDSLYCTVGSTGDPGPRRCCKKCHPCQCGPECRCEWKKKSD